MKYPDVRSSEAFEKGYRAKGFGCKADECPYEDNSPEYDAWHDGYFEASFVMRAFFD